MGSVKKRAARPTGRATTMKMQLTTVELTKRRRFMLQGMTPARADEQIVKDRETVKANAACYTAIICWSKALDCVVTIPDELR